MPGGSELAGLGHTVTYPVPSFPLVLAPDAIGRALAGNPFPGADTKNLHLGFLASIPGNPDLDTLSKLRKEGERFHLKENVFYLHAPEGIGRSRLASNAEKLLGVPMTVRNWSTVCKVMELAERRAGF